MTKGKHEGRCEVLCDVFFSSQSKKYEEMPKPGSLAEDVFVDQCGHLILEYVQKNQVENSEWIKQELETKRARR